MRDAVSEMRRPPLDPFYVFSELGITPMCTTESVVLDRHVHFYVDATHCDEIEAFADRRKYSLTNSENFFNTTLLECTLTRAKTWALDGKIRLTFLLDPSREVMDSFSETVKCGSGEALRQESGRVFTQAIALLIKTLHKGEEEKADALRKGIRQFFAGAQMKFPKIEGAKRKDKKIYFSDYNKSFDFDRLAISPEQFAYIMYTKEMHSPLTSLNIWVLHKTPEWNRDTTDAWTSNLNRRRHYSLPVRHLQTHLRRISPRRTWLSQASLCTTSLCRHA